MTKRTEAPRSLREIVGDSYTYMHKDVDGFWVGAERLVREAYLLGVAHGEGRIATDSYSRVIAAEDLVSRLTTPKRAARGKR